MKYLVTFFLVVVCCVVLISGIAQSQGLLERLQRTTSSSLQSYLTPILSGWARRF